MTAEALLSLDVVTVAFDGFKALNGLSLMLEPGEMRAVIGPNGAGKTTMMDVITGKTKPDTGRVVFGNDTDLTRLDEPAIARLGIGRKFQRPTVFEPLSVGDNVLLALNGDRSPRFALWAARRPMSARGSRISCGRPASPRSGTDPPPNCRTVKSSGWRSACCSRRIPDCCWSTSRWPV